MSVNPMTTASGSSGNHVGRRDRVEQAFRDELVALRVHRPRGDGDGRQDLDGQVELLEVVGDEGVGIRTREVADGRQVDRALDRRTRHADR